jgi:hypothetical protein
MSALDEKTTLDAREAKQHYNIAVGSEHRDEASQPAEERDPLQAIIIFVFLILILTLIVEGDKVIAFIMP